MSCDTTQYFKGAGEIWMATRNAAGITGPWVAMGDTDQLSVKIDRSYVEHYESCTGQQNRVVRVVDKTTWSMDMNTFDFSKEAIARVFLGNASAVTGSTVTGEAFTLYGAGTTFFTAKPDISTVVVTNTPGTTTLVADTDYTFNALNGAVTITTSGLAKVTVSGSNKTGLIDYAYAAYDNVETNLNGEQAYTIRFNGINTVDNEAMIVTIHNVTLSPASQFDMKGTEVAAYAITGAVNPDTTKGSGYSQYMTVMKTK